MRLFFVFLNVRYWPKVDIRGGKAKKLVDKARPLLKQAFELRKKLLFFEDQESENLFVARVSRNTNVRPSCAVTDTGPLAKNR